jgi:hypothetical protein
MVASDIVPDRAAAGGADLCRQFSTVVAPVVVLVVFLLGFWPAGFAQPVSAPTRAPATRTGPLLGAARGVYVSIHYRQWTSPLRSGWSCQLPAKPYVFQDLDLIKTQKITKCVTATKGP